MPEKESTTRTRQVLASWSGKPLKLITLDTHLDVLRVSHREELRSDLNDEFSNEGGFPIILDQWDDGALRQFRHVRDLVDRKLAEDGT